MAHRDDRAEVSPGACASLGPIFIRPASQSPFFPPSSSICSCWPFRSPSSLPNAACSQILWYFCENHFQDTNETSCLLRIGTGFLPFFSATSRTVALQLREHGLRPGKGLLCPQSQSLRREAGFSVICLCSQWQVLNKAKNHIQDLEHTLDNLLQLKGNGSYLPLLPSPPGKGQLVFLRKTETGLNQVNESLLSACSAAGTVLGPGVR